MPSAASGCLLPALSAQRLGQPVPSVVFAGLPPHCIAPLLMLQPLLLPQTIWANDPLLDIGALPDEHLKVPVGWSLAQCLMSLRKVRSLKFTTNCSFNKVSLFGTASLLSRSMHENKTMRAWAKSCTYSWSPWRLSENFLLSCFSQLLAEDLSQDVEDAGGSGPMGGWP